MCATDIPESKVSVKAKYSEPFLILFFFFFETVGQLLISNLLNKSAHKLNNHHLHLTYENTLQQFSERGKQEFLKLNGATLE